MSESVMSTGIMVPLTKKLTDEEREDITEELYDQESNVSINYEGTMAYTDIGGEEYGIHFGEMSELNESEFDILKQFGLSVDFTKARPYREYWYNGADSDHDMMKLEEFLRRTGQ